MGIEIQSGNIRERLFDYFFGKPEEFKFKGSTDLQQTEDKKINRGKDMGRDGQSNKVHRRSSRTAFL